MTSFYEELQTIASRQYMTNENKKQTILSLVKKWIKNNPIIDAALAGKIRLEILVGPIISPNLRISFFNRENDTFDSAEFQEWAKRLFEMIGGVLPLIEEGTTKKYPIALWLPVKTSQFYNMRRHCSCFLSTTMLLLLWGILSSESDPSLLKLLGEALSGGIIVGSFLEIIFIFLEISYYTRTRRKMAEELLKHAQGIDTIFREISLF